MVWRKVGFTALVAAAAVVCTAKGVPSSIMVFGDSLSDMGNISSGTFGLVPGSDYWQGRFSNGEVWIGDIATALSIPLKRSTQSGGTNFAYGGASSASGTYSFPFNFPNVSTQVSRYLASNTVPATALVVLWCGANDYFDGQTNAQVPVNNIGANITALYNKGARWFLVPNLPLLGSVPRYLNGSTPDPTMNALSTSHNLALKIKLTQLKLSLPGVTITTLDIATKMEDIRTHPSQYGFVNVTGQAIDAPSGTDVDTWLFWDDVHPTRKGHQLVANAALGVLKIPVKAGEGGIVHPIRRL
ncbi:MAG: SGNH/GDSL hydrolase family protein [Armatimonadetes bacterium]|nr:SGNH/GDSL hydrolase family protein [Armatimonadota bacterium]